MAKNNVVILTDSNSGITQQEANGIGVSLIPMPFTINGEEFFEGVNVTREQFYDFLAKNADVKTSQPSETVLKEQFADLLKKYNEVVYIPMSSGLSGTCENAKRYAQDFDGKVQVVDNKRISVSQKESVFEAIEMAKLGKSAKEIKDYLERSAGKSVVLIIMGVLKYLKKGGRISPAAALLGDMLKLKPILYNRGEKFEKLAITMSFGQAKKKVIDELKRLLNNDFKNEYIQGKMVISLAFTDDNSEALKFKDELIREIPNITFHFVDPLSLSVACHIGPGALGIAMSVNNFIY